MDIASLRLIAERAKQKGLLSPAPEVRPVPQPEVALVQSRPALTEKLPELGDRERDRRLRKHVKNGLDLDFEVMAGFMSLEINAEVSPLRLNTILTRRITEMKADGTFKKVPTVVLEMLESLRIPNFAPMREPEYTVTSRNDCLVVAGENVESTLRSKSVQGLLRHCQWQISGTELVLSGGFVTAFGPDAVRRIWRNCQASLC